MRRRGAGWARLWFYLAAYLGGTTLFLTLSWALGWWGLAAGW